MCCVLDCVLLLLLYVAKLPKPNPPSVFANGTTSVIVQIQKPDLPGVTLPVVCFIKYQKQGDDGWQSVQVIDCVSVTINNLQPGSHYIFIFVLKYQGHNNGSESDHATIFIKNGKCLMTLLNALCLR